MNDIEKTTAIEIDFIVKFILRKGLLELIKIEQELTMEFRKKNDFLIPRSTNLHIYGQLKVKVWSSWLGTDKGFQSQFLELPPIFEYLYQHS